MTKPLCLLLFITLSLVGKAQQNFLVLKKGNKIIDRFWPGNTVAFQLKNDSWQKGEITRIQNDSIYIRPSVVRYSMMGTDTVHFSVQGYSFDDIYAFPKKGVLIHYANGSYQVSRSGGHVHWYWVKSGWLFRAGALGYAALNVTNGLIKNDLTLKDGKLAAAAGVFIFGMILKRMYKWYLPLGKKYHLEIFNLSN